MLEQLLYLQKKNPRYSLGRRWVGPRASLGMVMNRETMWLLGIKMQSSSCYPSSLYWLSKFVSVILKILLVLVKLVLWNCQWERAVCKMMPWPYEDRCWILAKSAMHAASAGYEICVTLWRTSLIKRETNITMSWIHAVYYHGSK